MKNPPGDPMQIARKAFDSGDFRAAEHFFQLALRQFPDNIEALVKLSRCAGTLGSPRSARSHAMSAITIKGNPASRCELADQLSLIGESQAAFDILKTLSPETDMPILSKASAAVCLHRVVKLDDSLKWISQAASEVKNDARHATVHAFHGQLRRFHNHPAEALDAYEKAIRLDQHYAPSYLGRSLVQTATPEMQHVDNLRKMLSRCKPGSRSEGYFAYALFKELDDLGDHSAAWPVLERAWRAKRAEKNYHAARDAALHDRLAAIVPKLKQANEAPGGNFPIPIFILGQPRSGSTLLERLLTQHPDVEAGGELFDFTHQLHWCADISNQGFVSIEAAERVAHQDLSGLGQRYLEHVRWRAGGKKYVIDKMPLNYLLAGFIAKAIPGAILIHSMRDAMDTCYSQLKEHFDHAYEHSYSPGEVAEHFLIYRNFMQGLRQAMPERIYDCDHSQMIANPAAATEALFRHCGLDFTPAYLDIEKDHRPVSTASSSQVRASINSRGVGRWQAYATELKPMLARLQA